MYIVDLNTNLKSSLSPKSSPSPHPSWFFSFCCFCCCCCCYFCFDFCFGRQRAWHSVGVQMPKNCAEPSEFHKCFSPWSSFPVSSIFSPAVSFNYIFQFSVMYLLWSSFRSFMEWNENEWGHFVWLSWGSRCFSCAYYFPRLCPLLGPGACTMGKMQAEGMS